ncbi:hypothetical protein [Sphingosinicella sp. CPCC 101087]|uniref:hypothetical protein n=1 Tax=Sphingosinicella sp. CPCC 101087 TaxID=2497754 RepID=UPI00101BC483|nr:hypothetical protein [Sphingosinicella sp. CPCC 101087]
MKTAIFAAALLLGGAAIAQTTEDTTGQTANQPAAQPATPPPAESTTPPSAQPAAPPSATQSMSQPTTTPSSQPTTMPAASGAGTGTVAPSNESPERDARGIPVVSDPAEVPAGANQAQPIPPGATFTPNPNQAQVFTPRPATEEYPTCSRTVTDNCVQSYERGRSPE